MCQKEMFKLKFEFFLRCYYDLVESSVWDLVELEEYKYTAYKVLWQTRYSKTNIDGIDNQDNYTAFCHILNICLNQIDGNLMVAQNIADNREFNYIQKNIILIQAVNDVANDIEELLK